jgi:3-oxoacyl-[acyl-carrier protein] reductase
MIPSPDQPSYSAAKAALIQFTTSEALRLAPRSVRVNCVAPGSIEFPGGHWGRCRTEDPKQYAEVLASIPFGRYGLPEEIANAYAWLASDEASYINGAVIEVSGGVTI